MHIYAIVAMSENNAIGIDNRMPWHLPADLAHFKNVTLGKPVIMGRKTFESIGRPLPGRRNIIVTRDVNFTAENCDVVYSIEDALACVANADEIFIIGGANLYAQLMPKIEKLFLTIVHHTFHADAFFPPLDKNAWREIQRVDHAADEKNPYAYSFLTLERK